VFRESLCAGVGDDPERGGRARVERIPGAAAEAAAGLCRRGMSVSICEQKGRWRRGSTRGAAGQREGRRRERAPLSMMVLVKVLGFLVLDVSAVLRVLGVVHAGVEGLARVYLGRCRRRCRAPQRLEVVLDECCTHSQLLGAKWAAWWGGDWRPGWRAIFGSPEARERGLSAGADVGDIDAQISRDERGTGHGMVKTNRHLNETSLHFTSLHFTSLHSCTVYSQLGVSTHKSGEDAQKHRISPRARAAA